MTANETFMKEALSLASKGRGFTASNPLVGAVCVKDGQITGRGFHEKYGSHHAEVNAINDAGKNALGSDLYVTLEPCNHHGKTPPCTEKILESGIKRVFCAMEDPNPGVNGGGNEFLRSRGIVVKTGLLEKEAIALNLPFIKYITQKKPYTILKLAMTLDGRIATRTGDSKWITNSKSRLWSHNLRHQCDAVLVGRGTVEADDPSLTARIEGKTASEPLRIIADSRLSLYGMKNLKIFSEKMKSKTMTACCKSAPDERKSEFEKMGVDIIELPENKNSMVDMKSLLSKLGKMGISSLMIEGGSAIAGSFLNNGLVDQIAFFYGPEIIACSKSYSGVSGDGPEKLADAVKIKNIKTLLFDNDVLVQGRVSGSFFHNSGLLWPVFY
ncbi:MAG: riboflavin biosynthesis protein RibD [Deltaproteobacteria bacterium]|nr:MAG: riboflavin biosynthesis protein RibD [Deltaproteobacteria bacterium]